MRKLLKGMSNIDNLEDIIVFTSTWEQHMQVFELLTYLRDAKLTINLAIFIGFHDLECLGHMVGASIIKPCPVKVLAIEGAFRPISKSRYDRLHGLCDFIELSFQTFLRLLHH